MSLCNNPLEEYLKCLNMNDKTTCYKNLQRNLIERDPITLCEERFEKTPKLNEVFDWRNVSFQDQQTLKKHNKN